MVQRLFSEGWVGRPLGSVGSMVPLGVDMYVYLEPGVSRKDVMDTGPSRIG